MNQTTKAHGYIGSIVEDERGVHCSICKANFGNLSYLKGYVIHYDHTNRMYVWCDDGTTVKDNPRVCRRCNNRSTPEGYDSCLGYISGVKSACCGHGIEPSYVMRTGMKSEKSTSIS